MLVLSLFWAFNRQFYPLMIGLLFAFALFIFFKIRLMKSVRELTRKDK
jgi:Ca2+/Na+ antiporter